MGIAAQTGNTTNQIFGVCDNQTFMSIAAETGNTSAEMQSGVNSSNLHVDWIGIDDISNLSATFMLASTPVGNDTSDIQTAINASHITLDTLIIPDDKKLYLGTDLDVWIMFNTTAGAGQLG